MVVDGRILSPFMGVPGSPQSKLASTTAIKASVHAIIVFSYIQTIFVHTRIAWK